MSTPTPEEWLRREDASQREHSLARLRWVEAQMPEVDWVVFGCGPISRYLFEEARYCYVYGQFLASVTLGLAFIEMSLAGAFYAAGRTDLRRAGITELAREAFSRWWLRQTDYETLERVRLLLNSITHFRPPGEDERPEASAFPPPALDCEVTEADAHEIMQVAFHLFTKVVPFANSK